MVYRGRRSRHRWTVAAALAAATTAARANAQSLTWDASGTSPTAPQDGSGTWTGSPTWSNGTADVAWTDGSSAVIGTGTGSAPYTISLAANVSAGSIEFDSPGPNAAYTINGNGYTLASPTANLFDYGASLTLRNGTFTTGDATGNNPAAVVLESGATLRLGTGATLATTALVGDSSPTTVVFDGGTFQALANPSARSATIYTQVVGTTAAYISAGGLTFDTSAVPNGICYVTDALTHDPAITGPDGGLTVVGGGTLQLGVARQVPPFNPVETYAGTTTVGPGTTLILSTAGNTTATSSTVTTGPFPNTRFVVNGGTLAVAATDAIAGETGTTPVTVNAGTLTLTNGASARLVTVTLNGGTLTANTSASVYTLAANGLLHATGTATVSVAGLAPAAGSVVSADAGVTLTIASPVVDPSTAPGQLTVAGAGTVVLAGTSTYTGSTNVSAGSTLTVTGTLTGSPSLTTAGNVVLSPTGTTGRTIRPFGAVTVAAGGTVSLTPAATSAARTVLTTPSLSIAAGGRLDLGNGDLIVTAGGAAELTALTQAAATGFAAGTWTGSGLTSTAAAGDASHLSAVGVIRNVAADGVTPLYGTFDGQSVTAAAVLARYTLYGDTNLDGVVNAADYTRIDVGFVNHLTGWANGDFNYDGVVDGTDYALMDNAFNHQSNAVATPAAAVATLAATVPEPSTVLLMIAVGIGWARRRRASSGHRIGSPK